MIVSYLRIGLRNLLRNKVYSIINISGLATGLAVATLIGLWTIDELSFNSSFSNSPRIAEVYHNLMFGDDLLTHDAVAYPFGSALKSRYPNFEEVVMASERDDHFIHYKDAVLTKTAMFVEPGFVDMFSLDVVMGSSSLTELRSVIVSTSFAASLAEDPIGVVLKLDNKDDVVVGGVFTDFPENSEFSGIDILLPMAHYFTTSEDRRAQIDSWEHLDFQCFVLLSSTASFEQAGKDVNKLCYELSPEVIRAMEPEGFLFPMEMWHLYSEFKDGMNVGGKIQFVWMFSIIGLFVLVLACINFINLSTARSERRAREVGIRKVMGSLRVQLVKQFLGESVLVVVVAFILSIAIVVLVLPTFNYVAGKHMVLPWTSAWFILLGAAVIIVTSVLAGGYPAFYLSSFDPVKVLRRTFKTGSRAALPRKALVVFQFMISIILIVSTVMIFRQIQHARDRQVGFDRDRIVYVEVRTKDLASVDYNTLRSAILGTGMIDNVAKSDHPITGGSSAVPNLSWEGKDPGTSPLIAMNSCSHDFPATTGFRFIEGRDFSRDLTTDSMALIVNESAARLFSEASAIGKKITMGGGKEREIIGVIKDQIRWNPFGSQGPHIFYIDYKVPGYLNFRIKPDVEIAIALEEIGTVLKRFDEGAPFDFQFLDEDYARQFVQEERVARLSGVFSILAIFISCLGIFGLASFSASQRTREIGIRKILGASVVSIWRMLSGDFVRLVVVAIILASPLAYYLCRRWLQQYEYRIELSWWFFAVAGLGALIITISVVSYQSIKAATTNPVDSLRSE